MEAFILFSHAKSSLQGHHSPILPKLQSLQWTWRDDQDKFTTQIGTILSGPNLLRLTFAAQRAETDTHPTQSFECTVLSLASVAPNLQQVVLSFSSDPSTTITDAVSRFLNRLPNLRLFECRSPLPSETLLSLARCPYLHDLDIRLSRNLKDYALTSSPASNFFPNIQNVHIWAKEVRRAILFLDNLQSQFVKRVNITTSARTLLLSEVGNYFKCLASRGSLEKIIFQKFSGSSGQSSPRDTSVMRFGTFAPLLKLRNITILAVSSGFAIDLDDECIKRFSEAWPKLYRLSILSERPLPTSPKITLESFLILLQNCPNIYTIGLTLGSCTPTSTNWDLLAALQLSKPDLGINVHQITVRNCSRVEDWEVVGDFIHSMFPTCHVSVDDTKMDDYEEMQRISSWEEVKRHVRRGRQDRRARLETVRTSGELPDRTHLMWRSQRCAHYPQNRLLKCHGYHNCVGTIPSVESPSLPTT